MCVGVGEGVPSNLMTQHHLGRLVAAPALVLRAKPILLSGLFHFLFLLAPPTTTNFLFLLKGRIFSPSHFINRMLCFFLPSDIPQVPLTARGLPFAHPHS